MQETNDYDVIIIGGSYAGLAAGMALGRALKKVLIIDSQKPCNRQTPHSHNFLTQDGQTPGKISAIAKEQVQQYKTISFFEGIADKGFQTSNGFTISTTSGEEFKGSKLIFATGIRDILPSIEGLAECWGISAVHCPYCHGYEIREQKTGILANGDVAFELVKLISNWTKDLTLFTNGPSTLKAEQQAKLEQHHIAIVEKEIVRLAHQHGQLQHIVFKDNAATTHLNAMYVKAPFEQHCKIPEALGCALTEDGFIKTELFETTIPNVYACGDNASGMRTVAHAVYSGTATGMFISKKLIADKF
ncbi:MAG TPA: NAD(P)/FAD-dependent oxidoreductase [Cytophagaceae bacterium]|nr:NAD(P)/FAD-dependent oxidoreductase [Cytophagaceae bacterium]